MADNKPTPKKKRRLKPAPASVREQRNKTSNVQTSRFRTLVRKVGRWIAWPFVWVSKLKIWQSPVFKPFRFVFKIIGYILFIPYLKNSFSELKQVTWPSFRQTNRLTLAVLIFAVFFGALVAVIDYGFDKLFKELILK